MPGAGLFSVLWNTADYSYSSESRFYPAVVVVRDYFNSM